MHRTKLFKEVKCKAWERSIKIRNGRWSERKKVLEFSLIPIYRQRNDFLVFACKETMKLSFKKSPAVGTRSFIREDHLRNVVSNAFT